jgi:ABC-type multidrug transport system ATPase subunit
MTDNEYDKAEENEPVTMEEPGAITQPNARNPRRLHSAQSSGMESSVLRFNLNFTVGSKGKQKAILSDVAATVKWGHVLAIMGPSGAGKSVLISALTLDALFGRTEGRVTLNGVPLTDKIFKSHCYTVVQLDQHWPYLTCRETLRYAAELYDVAAKEDIDAVVDEIVQKMGLDVCVDTRNARLSGGQRRRLSLGIALLKQPTLLFLDEPTTGLDAASAENIMQEIVRVAKEENLIILCTIHQPSTKVYQGFDEVMVLSKGREAYTGNVKESVPYFESIGYPLPPQTNPAEHFLDMVNADFSDDAEVDLILDTWQEKRPGAGSSHHKKGFGGVDNDDEGQEGVADVKRAPLRKEISIMFSRHLKLMVRDPVLYSGRAVIFFVVSLLFSLVYLNARDYSQDQALNKMWIVLWLVSVPSNMGVVAVYALNEEFKSILRESKNGMASPLSYALAKTVLVIPIMFVFALFALVIASFVVIDMPWDTFGVAIIIYAATMYVFECVAECLSVWFENPILGMLQFMNFWFGSFLFAGFLISKDDLFWPFTLFYYIMPYAYYLRSSMYNYLKDTTFDSCEPGTSAGVCVQSTSGSDVLGGINLVYNVVENEDTISADIATLIGIAIFYKILYIIGVVYKSSRVTTIHEAAK